MRAIPEVFFLEDAAGEMALRDATPADQPALALLHLSLRDDLAALGQGPAATALIALQQRIHADGLRRHYPAARQLLLHRVGRCVAQLVLDRSAQRLRVIDITVLPDVRRQGLGRALVRWAQQQAAAAGLPLALQVRGDNRPARELYRSTGFSLQAADELFEELHWHGMAAA